MSAALRGTLRIIINGKAVRVPKIQAICMRIVNEALGGNLKAAELMLKLLPAKETGEDSMPDFVSILLKDNQPFLALKNGSHAIKFQELQPDEAARAVAATPVRASKGQIVTFDMMALDLGFANAGELEKAEKLTNGRIITRGKVILKHCLINLAGRPEKRIAALGVLDQDHRWGPEGVEPTAQEVADVMKVAIREMNDATSTRNHSWLIRRFLNRR
jgi:hypothetical protein